MDRKFRPPYSGWAGRFTLSPFLAYGIFFIMPSKHGQYDVIIIGAGVGGLTAAAMLVKAGLQVLVLEKNPHPGGTAYVFQRKGFTFPMGPLGFSSPSLVKDTLRDAGGNDPQLIPAQYQINAFGLEIPLSRSFGEMKQELKKRFSGENDAINSFFRYMEEILSAMQSSNDDFKRSVLEKALIISAFDYLSNLIKDMRLRRILGSIGTQEPYSGVPLLAAMWSLMCNDKIWYPTGGMRSFCEDLSEAVVDHHRNHPGFGEIRLRTEVSEIRVQNGKVLGVALNNGEEIDSSAVISNADYKTTFLKLFGPKSIPAEWRHALQKARQTRSILQVCLGVDAKQVDLSPFKEADRLIYRRKLADELTDSDWNTEKMSPEKLAGQEMEISLWSKHDRTLGAEGTEVIVIRTEAEHTHFKRYRPDWGKRCPGYTNYKMELGKGLVCEAEKLIPGLEKAILVMDVATPLTFEEQGGRSEGAVAGWSWDYKDCIDYLPRELIRTPVQGLYMAGYQAFSNIFMGGVPTAMESGKRAARAVLEDVGPVAKIMI